MKKIVLTWGLISGAVTAAIMLTSIAFADSISFDKGEVVGYTTLVLSMLLVFFGVRSYRQGPGGGRLGFGRGFTVGLLIALVSGVCYVAAWEVAYFKFLPDFADKYGAHMVEKARAGGAGPDKLEEIRKQAQQYKRLWDNPLTNAAVTFLEPLPFGLVAALVSAAVLRKR